MARLRTILIAAACLITLSCSNKDSALSKAVSEWTGKKLLFPKEMTFFKYGETPVEVAIDKNYKILHYVDANGCVPCMLRLMEWKEYIKNIEKEHGNNVCVIFAVSPNDKTTEVANTLKTYGFDYPIYLDISDSLNILNNFHEVQQLRTFLLDKHNHVLAVGDPIFNPEIKRLYKKRINSE